MYHRVRGGQALCRALTGIGHRGRLNPLNPESVPTPASAAFLRNCNEAGGEADTRLIGMSISHQPSRNKARKPSCSKCRSLVNASVSPSRRIVIIEMQSVKL